jgi:hypothetical protein
MIGKLILFFRETTTNVKVQGSSGDAEALDNSKEDSVAKEATVSQEKEKQGSYFLK